MAGGTTINDLPFATCAEDAKKLVAKGLTVHQKFSCEHCGARQLICRPNTFYTSASCEECSKVTEIKQCGYLLIGNTRTALGLLSNKEK